MSSRKWVLFEHFCDELYKYHKEILDDKIFSSTPLTSFGITKTIFEDFEQFTINNKNFKGFPTAKGPRMCEKLPKKTKIPKSNDILVKMLSNYFTSSDKRNYIERVLKLELQRGPKITLQESNPSDDSDEDLDVNYATIQIKQEPSEEKKRKSVDDVKESPTPKQRKVEDSMLNTNENPHDSPVNTHNSPLKTEDPKSTNPKVDINKQVMVKLKRDMKDSIEFDENQKNKDMPKTKEVSKQVQALLESSKYVYSNEMQDITLSRQLFEERVASRIKFLEENLQVYIVQLEKMNENLSCFIAQKEEEFKNLEAKEETELDSYLDRIFVKKE